MAKRKTKKKTWKNFEVIKVKLNPEQAVLSCCAQAANRLDVEPTLTYQCAEMPCNGPSGSVSS